MKSKALVVGGAGYIGSHVAKQLETAGHETTVFDDFSTGFRQLTRSLPVIEGDICDLQSIDAALAEVRPDVVFLFAGLISVGESMQKPDIYYQNNVTGILNTLQAIMKNAPKARVVFSSTAAVYGVPAGELNEEHPTRPINPYGRTKLIIEDALRDYAHAFGLKYSCIRYFNAAGSEPDLELGELHEPETHLIPRILLHAIKKDAYPVKIFGDDYETPDGTCIRDYVHVSDLARIHLLAMDYLNDRGNSLVVNAGSGNGYSVAEVVAMAEAVIGRKLDVPVGVRREGDPARLIANSDKAKKLLGWQPEFDLRDMVTTSWQFIQKKRSS